MLCYSHSAIFYFLFLNDGHNPQLDRVTHSMGLSSQFESQQV